MTTWITLLSRPEGPTVAELAALPTAELCRRIAAAQWAMVVGEVQALSVLPAGKARDAELARLARGELVTERMAAEIVRRREDQSKGKPRGQRS